VNKDKFSIEYESIEDYIKARTVVEGGSAGGGGGGTFIHSELEGLDYESSGHTGFASTDYVDGELLALANTMNNQVGSIEAILGTPKDGTIAKDIENIDTKLQAVLDKFMPQPDAPDPEVPSYIPEYYELATDEDFSGTANGSFKYIGTKEYVIVPYRIKGVVVRSYKEMFANKAVKGVASYSDKVLDFTKCFASAGVSGQPLELKYLDVSGAYVFKYIFYNCKASELDLSSWNTSRVYLMDYAFQQCKASYINVSGWDTSKVSTFYNTFDSCAAQTIEGLGDWTNENATEYGSMFNSAYYLLVLDLSGFTTPLVGSFYYMLSGTSSVLEAYAKTQEDANWLNTASTAKPGSWNFTVKGA